MSLPAKGRTVEFKDEAGNLRTGIVDHHAITTTGELSACVIWQAPNGSRATNTTYFTSDEDLKEIV
jgi:inorganic pyrophosphatase/exopolyphosphatase